MMFDWSKNLQKKLSEAKMRIDLSSLRSSLRSLALSVLGYQLKMDQNRRPTAVLLTTVAKDILRVTVREGWRR